MVVGADPGWGVYIVYMMSRLVFSLNGCRGGSWVGMCILISMLVFTLKWL